MSSFQPFKSFVKIQPKSNSPPQHCSVAEKKQISNPSSNDPITKYHNQSQSQSNPIKIAKRTKKIGSICNFILKVYSMLQEKQISHIVTWSEKDTSLSSKNINSDYKNQIRSQNNINSFQILDLQKFEEVVLPKYFKHSNMSSFVRQLNMYGFHKLRGDKGNYEFQHEKFSKNNKQLLSEIRRKNPELGGISSSHLEENPQMSLRNLKSIQDRISFLSENRPVTQQELLSFRDEYTNPNIFPSELYLPQKKVSLEVRQQNEQENSAEKQKNRKIQLIEEQNNRLRKIKLSKIQKIKELKSINKSEMQMKLSKIIFSFLSIRLRQNIKNQAKNEIEAKQISIPISENKVKFIKPMISNEITNHILSNQEVKSFKFYQNNIQSLLQKHTIQKQRQKPLFQ